MSDDGLDEETPFPYAKDVKVPTLMVQFRRDFFIHGDEDGQAIFDALGAEEKELLWLEDSNQRFYAYNYFGRFRQLILDRAVASHESLSRSSF